MRRATRSIVLAFSLVLLALAPAAAAQAGEGGWKAAHDNDPHLALTPEQLEMTAQKRAAEAAYTGPDSVDSGFLGGHGIENPSTTCGSTCGGGGGFPSSASLVANQTPQQTSYWCGPASVHEALGALGVSLSQAQAAAELHTTTAGTAWSGGGTSPSGYPVPDVMNAHQSHNYYVPQYVPSATSTAIGTYETDLEVDIFAVGAPLIGDAWEVPSGYHLIGHPANQQIFHWFEIRGYQTYGASTMYEDSVHGATSIGWSPGVPAYSTLPSSEIVSIVSGRGYVW